MYECMQAEARVLILDRTPCRFGWRHPLVEGPSLKEFEWFDPTQTRDGDGMLSYDDLRPSE